MHLLIYVVLYLAILLIPATGIWWLAKHGDEPSDPRSDEPGCLSGIWGIFVLSIPYFVLGYFDYFPRGQDVLVVPPEEIEFKMSVLEHQINKTSEAMMRFDSLTIHEIETILYGSLESLRTVQEEAKKAKTELYRMRQKRLREENMAALARARSDSLAILTRKNVELLAALVEEGKAKRESFFLGVLSSLVATLTFVMFEKILLKKKNVNIWSYLFSFYRKKADNSKQTQL